MKAHISCSITFYLNRAFCEIIWKNIIELDRPQMKIRRTRIACWITNATNAHSEYVILMAFSLQQWFTNAPQCYVIRTLPVFDFTVGQEPKSGLGRLNVYVCKSQTITQNTHGRTPPNE